MKNILKNSTILIKSKNNGNITTGAIPMHLVTIPSAYSGGKCIPLFCYVEENLRWLELKFAGLDHFHYYFKAGDKITIEIDVKE